MSAATPFPVAVVGPIRGKPNEQTELHGEGMTKAEQAEIAEIRESVMLLTKLTNQTVSGQPQTSRSIDILRRDIGIFAILIGMMVQTGAAFYWAGGVSRSQESAAKITETIQQEQAYVRAQLQLIDGKLQKIEGRDSERDRLQQQKRR